MNNNYQYRGFAQHPQQQSDFDEIRTQNSGPMQWNMGQQQYQQQQQQPSSDGVFYFKPSPIFQGPMSGWYFGTGEFGTGYYMDIN